MPQRSRSRRPDAALLAYGALNAVLYAGLLPAKAFDATGERGQHQPLGGGQAVANGMRVGPGPGLGVAGAGRGGGGRRPPGWR